MTNEELRVTNRRGDVAQRTISSSFAIRSSFSLSRGGFTLVEIVIALTLLIIIAAASIPTFRGLRAEQAAREPIQELTRMAKEARLKAMREKKAYQIVIHSGGFTASRYLSPYLQLADLNEFMVSVAQEAEAPPDEEELANETNASRPTGDQVIYTKSATGNSDFKDWTEEYKLPEGTRVSVQYWHELTPVAVEGEIVKLWVFQPTGICQPLKVSLENETASIQIEFASLTADIVRESTDIK